MAITKTQAVAAAERAGITTYEIETAAGGLRSKLEFSGSKALADLRTLKEKPEAWLLIATRIDLLNAAALLTAEAWKRKATRNRG